MKKGKVLDLKKIGIEINNLLDKKPMPDDFITQFQTFKNNLELIDDSIKTIDNEVISRENKIVVDEIKSRLDLLKEERENIRV